MFFSIILSCLQNFRPATFKATSVVKTITVPTRQRKQQKRLLSHVNESFNDFVTQSIMQVGESEYETVKSHNNHLVDNHGRASPGEISQNPTHVTEKNILPTELAKSG